MKASEVPGEKGMKSYNGVDHRLAFIPALLWFSVTRSRQANWEEEEEDSRGFGPISRVLFTGSTRFHSPSEERRGIQPAKPTRRLLAKSCGLRENFFHLWAAARPFHEELLILQVPPRCLPSCAHGSLRLWPRGALNRRDTSSPSPPPPPKKGPSKFMAPENAITPRCQNGTSMVKGSVPPKHLVLGISWTGGLFLHVLLGGFPETSAWPLDTELQGPLP